MENSECKKQNELKPILFTHADLKGQLLHNVVAEELSSGKKVFSKKFRFRLLPMCLSQNLKSLELSASGGAKAMEFFRQKPSASAIPRSAIDISQRGEIVPDPSIAPDASAISF